MKPLSLLAVVLLLHGAARAGQLPRRKVSDNDRFFVTEERRPLFRPGDTKGELFTKLTDGEAKDYIGRRKEQGFNALQVQLTGFLGMTNRAGERPFAGRPPEQDFAQPNEKFFAQVDRVMAEAQRQGILLAIAPAWSGCCGEGWQRSYAMNDLKEQVRDIASK